MAAPYPDPTPWVDGLVEGRRGELVQRKHGRVIWRVGSASGVCFAKRGTGTKRRELRTEARNLVAMAAAGLPVVPLLAAGEHRRAFWLVTAAAPGIELGEALGGAIRSGDDDRRRAMLGAAAWSFRSDPMLLVPALFLYGTCYGFIMNATHELSHQSVFKTRFLNEFVLRLLCFFARCLKPFLTFS